MTLYKLFFIISTCSVSDIHTWLKHSLHEASVLGVTQTGTHSCALIFFAPTQFTTEVVAHLNIKPILKVYLIFTSQNELALQVP